MGFSHQDAEDAVQEALVRGVQRLQSHRVHELKNWDAWLRAVAVNAALTIARRRKWVALSEADAPCVTPSDEFERREERCARLAALSEAINGLPDELRRFLDYCTVEGNPLRDAARKFGMPASTVRRRLVEALRRVRGDLRSRGFDIPDPPAKRRKSCALTRGARL